MTRALAILIVAIGTHAATLTDDRIAEVIQRLDALSARESPGPRADTRQREAELLRNVQPALAASLAISKPALHAPIPSHCSAPTGLDDAAKALFIEDALAFIKTLRVIDQHVPLGELLDCTEQLQVAPKLIELVARQFLHVVEHTTELPAGYERLSAIRRRYELTAGGDNVSVRARDALAELAALVSTDYDFTLHLLNGKPVTLKEQRGKVILMTFWATWCAPCITEMPVFEKLYRDHPNDAFQLLAISDEPAGDVALFMKQHGYTFPVVLDPDHIAFGHYQIPGMPSTRVLDKTGRLRAESGAITGPELNHLLSIAGLPALPSQLN